MNNVFQATPREVIDMGATSTYFNKFMAQVFGFMSLGLLITAITSFGVMYLSAYSDTFFSLFTLSLPIVLIIEVILVLSLSFLATKLNGFLAFALFILYAVVNGIFLSVILMGYTFQSVAVAFGASFLTFAVMALYGYFTKSDLTRWRSLAIMALIGVLIGTFINLIVSFISPGVSDALYWILTYGGLGVFIILTAADTQKLKQLSYSAETQGGIISSYAAQGALMLYLDFINIFIRILGITGKRR